MVTAISLVTPCQHRNKLLLSTILQMNIESSCSKDADETDGFPHLTRQRHVTNRLTLVAKSFCSGFANTMRCMIGGIQDPSRSP